MMTIREAIAEAGEVTRQARPLLVHLVRPWQSITGLSLLDCLHLSHEELLAGLTRVHQRLGDCADVLEEEQAQELACRCLKSIIVLGPRMEEEGVSIRSRGNVEWTGSTWLHMGEHRHAEGVSSYREALAAVKTRLGR